MESSVTKLPVVSFTHPGLFPPELSEIPVGCHAEQRPGSKTWIIVNAPGRGAVIIPAFKAGEIKPRTENWPHGNAPL